MDMENARTFSGAWLRPAAPGEDANFFPVPGFGGEPELFECGEQFLDGAGLGRVNDWRGQLPGIVGAFGADFFRQELHGGHGAGLETENHFLRSDENPQAKQELAVAEEFNRAAHPERNHARTFEGRYQRATLPAEDNVSREASMN